MGELKRGKNNWNFTAVGWPCDGSACTSAATMAAVLANPRKVEEPEPEPQPEPVPQEEERETEKPRSESRT